jgi:hypothetical protein
LNRRSFGEYEPVRAGVRHVSLSPTTELAGNGKALSSGSKNVAWQATFFLGRSGSLYPVPRERSATNLKTHQNRREINMTSNISPNAKVGDHASAKRIHAMQPLPYAEVRNRIITIRGQAVIVDADVAALYGVETRQVNEAVRNNPDKFPPDYRFELTENELSDLRSKFSTTTVSPKSRVLPKAFTEKGLYMLATVLKSRRATEATFAIIETFAKVRALKRELVELHREADAKNKPERARRFGKMLADVVMPDLGTVETESSLELNFFIGKIKHTVRKVRRTSDSPGA